MYGASACDVSPDSGVSWALGAVTPALPNESKQLPTHMAELTLTRQNRLYLSQTGGSPMAGSGFQPFCRCSAITFV